MGLLYLIILIAAVAICFYITRKALGDADGAAGFSLGRFIIQAVLAGVPGMLWLTTLGSSSSLNTSVIIFFIVAAIIHILYCIKLFGTGRGIAVAFCSMAASSIIVIMMIFTMEQLKNTFRSLSGKGTKK